MAQTLWLNTATITIVVDRIDHFKPKWGKQGTCGQIPKLPFKTELTQGIRSQMFAVKINLLLFLIVAFSGYFWLTSAEPDHREVLQKLTATLL